MGISPPARKIRDGIFEQEYVNFKEGWLTEAVENEDYPAIVRTIKGLKKVHEKGVYLRDAATVNLSDPLATGGYVTVDTSNIGFIPEGRWSEYVIGDLAKTHGDAAQAGHGRIVYRAIRHVYGKRIADRVAERSRGRKIGERIELLPITPFPYRQLRRAA